MKILLVEDDAMIGRAVKQGLTAEKFTVDWAQDGVAADLAIGNGGYDLVVLDLGLPRKDGLDVLAGVRRAGVATPVLVLTARDAVPERVRGLNAGADDYVIKPVDLDELAARLRALVRRAHGQPLECLSAQNVVLDTAARSVRQAGETVVLSTREFDLLQVFMLSANRVLSREQLEQQLYSWGQEVESNAIEVHIHNLRRKLGAGLIHTVRGVGYLLPRDTPPA